MSRSEITAPDPHTQGPANSSADRCISVSSLKKSQLMSSDADSGTGQSDLLEHLQQVIPGLG